MNNRAKNPPQTENQMRAALMESKKSKIYKVEADAHRADQLSALVNRRAAEMMRAADDVDRVRLSDTDIVKGITLKYISSCADVGAIPSMLGLCRALGYSSREIYKVIANRTYPATADWLEYARDTFSDILAESALTNNVNATFAIFAQKAQYAWKESVELDVKPIDPLGDRSLTPEQIMEKYADIIDD